MRAFCVAALTSMLTLLGVVLVYLTLLDLIAK